LADIAYLDGAYLPLQEARVPVLDRGYLFGDGVYEVIAVYGGAIFALDAHLTRLEASLKGIGIPNPLSRSQLQHVLQELVTRNGGGDLMLYMQITRGVQAARSFAFPADPKPCLLAFCQPLPPPTRQILEQGVSAITLQDFRWLNCHIKSIALLGNTMLANSALKAGCNEAVLLRDGQLTEGGSSNVFIVKDGRAATPPKSNLILAGITRDILLELAKDAGVPCDERAIAEAEVRGADELWITSTTRELYAVTQLDGKPVGNGKPGPLWRRMYDLFQARKQRGS
jgi:D-alanine transaminase